MAELNESKMNFAALKRVDPYAKGLLETAAHVALYAFINNEWEKTDIEGALFVYSRTGEPFHNILIMNRLNMKNLVEPVTQGLDLHLQDPFLLYRDPQGSIYGIWFYDEEECENIAQVLMKIIKEALESKSESVGRQPVPSGNNVDIFSMLTKAQEEFNSKSPRKTKPDLLGTSHDMNYNLKESDLTPQSVLRNGSKFVQDTNINQPPGMFINSSRSGPPPGLSRMPSLKIAIPPPQNDVNPLLQRLMSNPVYSVEHIEKQQRAITPQQGDFVGFLKNGNHMLGLSTSNSSDTRNSFLFNTTHGFSVRENGPVNIPGIPQSKVENGLSFIRISDSPPSVVQSQQFFNSKLAQSSSPLVTEGSTESNLIQTENRPLSAPMDLKPALMPPVMFTSSAKKYGSMETRNSFSFNTTHGFSVRENGPVNIPGIPQSKVENGLSFIRISDSPPSVMQSQQFFNSKLAQSSSPLVTKGSTESNLIQTENRPLSAPMDLKPALMPPVMFTSSAKKYGSMETITTAAPPVVGNSIPGNSAPQTCPEPLTKKRLMSNPVYSVEHIEKQQRAITPQQGDFVGFLKNGNHMLGLSTSNSSDTRNSFLFNTTHGFSVRENGPVNIPGIPQSKVENGLSFIRISDSPPSVVQSQQFFNSKLAQSSSPLVTEGSTESNLIQTENRPLSAPMDLKPALMPPVMFTSSAKKYGSMETITTAAPPVVGNSIPGNSAPQTCPEPLTKKQLIQAINYLLKHDPEFMNKLHEAYLKSFAELVS